MHYTYVLLSSKDNKTYIGSTAHLKRRFQEHNSGKVLSTRHRLPLQLVYFEACPSEEAALAREKQLKTGFGRAYLKRRLGLVAQR